MLFSPTIYLQKKMHSYAKNYIISGFFKGLKYETYNNLNFSIIAGTYEKELFPVLEEIENYDNIIDIGAGDGYYAAGLLYKFNHIKLYAFEILADRKKSLLNNLSINNINLEKCEIFDGADSENLNIILKKIASNSKTFIIVDVEGYEKTLLNLELSPLLKNCTILVEVHDHFVKGISEILKIRFKHTHKIKIVPSTKRKTNEIGKPFNIFEKWIFKPQLERLLGEGRGAKMEWFYFEPIKTHSI